MKLYCLAGSCALAPHIALEHSGLAYEAVRVERGKQADPSYRRCIFPNCGGPDDLLATEGIIWLCSLLRPSVARSPERATIATARPGGP